MRTLEQATEQAWAEYDAAEAVVEKAGRWARNVSPADLEKLAGLYESRNGRLECVEGGVVKRTSALVECPDGQLEHARDCGRLAGLHRTGREKIWLDPFIRPLLERCDRVDHEALEVEWKAGYAETHVR